MGRRSPAHGLSYRLWTTWRATSWRVFRWSKSMEFRVRRSRAPRRTSRCKYRSLLEHNISLRYWPKYCLTVLTRRQRCNCRLFKG